LALVNSCPKTFVEDPPKTQFLAESLPAGRQGATDAEENNDFSSKNYLLLLQFVKYEIENQNLKI
jgi:hypothetical protein